LRNGWGGDETRLPVYMSTLVKGLHHVTLCAAGAQEDIEFFTAVMGLRLVKQSVLMDGSIPIYHFYYANADADVGSITTSFPYSRKPGRAGSGQVAATSYAVPPGTLSFWLEHFDRYGAEHSGRQERFGAGFIRVRHPAGLLLEVVEAHGDCRRPWTTPEIGADVGTRGFFAAVLSVRDVCEQEAFLTDALGLCKVGVDGRYHRFEIPGAPAARFLDLLHEPDRAAGSWGFGAGTVHHLALDLETDEALLQQKAIYEELGFTDASELKDRYYFHSMYVRSPGGILIECTSNVPAAFYLDETFEELGTKLHLPPWYEEQREAIVAMLEPITVPRENRPKRGATNVPRAVAEGVTSRVPLSRSAPRFHVGKG
jgi:glyoxalase family protein